ncbi:PaaI family thioesterase [Palleronia sp. LCG004]|uniref:PaaI family thioesterase n=1 Tax=Palleronia sp. LCG004 TaxID=3079304 RepID=UPI002943F41E|nr:PaaI family thioesterase [Palleronia sp. LCG004]WOI56557.1 PaaI family thioesterase [Palleronia sp. LCG004]
MTADAPGIIRDETGTQRTLGYVLDVGQGDGRGRCRLVVDERHTNRHGVLHGGLVTVMLDTAMGATGSLSMDETGTYPMLTISLTVNFVSSARLGQSLEAEGRLTGGGRKVKFIAGELRDDEGTLVATATGVFRTLPDHRRS